MKDEKLDLSTDDGRHRLKECVIQRRIAGCQDESEDEFICSSVEIFWPQSFLKVRQNAATYIKYVLPLTADG